MLKAAIILAATILVSTATIAAEQRETQIRHRGGSGTVVRTDDHGTRTRNSQGGGTTYGDQRHDDAVREHSRPGSTIEKDCHGKFC